MKNKTKRQYVKVSKSILDTIAAKGLTLAEDVSKIVTHLLFPKSQSKYGHHRKYYVNKQLQKLKERGMVEFKKNKQGFNCVSLTKKGLEELKKYELEELTIKRPARWDGKFHLILFDIKEWKRGKRDRLRGWLEGLGFVKLQNSAWIFPYDCQEVIILLKSYFQLGKEVLYLKVDSVENDKRLREGFGL